MIDPKNIFLFLFLLGLNPYISFSQNKVTPSELPENTLIYGLPKTCLIVKIKYIRTTCQKGEFADYTREFLGFEPNIKKTYTKYEILDADIESFVRYDANKMLYLSPEKGDLKFDMIDKLSNEGLIITKFDDINIPVLSDNINPAQIVPKKYVPFESLYKDRIDTIYKREFRDSSWVEVPYYERKYLLKEEQDLAHEAADLIIWLNYNLVKSAERLNPVDEYDANVSGSLYNETNKILKKYLMLFNGVCQTDTFTFSAVVIPEKENKSYIITGFSGKEGITKNRKGDGNIILNIDNQSNSQQIEAKFNALNKYKDRLFYRIPEDALISVNFGDMELFKGYISIYQLGGLISLPPRMVIGK